jgi:hypothetical protein
MNEMLTAWQQRLGLTNVQAAKLLNETPLRTYEDWKAGRNVPPRVLKLALIEAERRHVAARQKRKNTASA